MSPSSSCSLFPSFFSNPVIFYNNPIDPDQEGDTATQSIIGLFGGELEFDNRHIYHHSHAGRTTGIVINYGKNLQTINDDTNLDNTYTAIYPIAKYTPGQAIATEKNTDWANWETDWNSIGTVIYTAGGSVDIYDSPVEGHHVRSEERRVGKECHWRLSCGGGGVG